MIRTSVGVAAAITRNCTRHGFPHALLAKPSSMMAKNVKYGSSWTVPPSCFTIADEVRTALHTGRAVVALESTIVAHGMPFPQNLETARAVEDTVRASGAVPATIAVINGRVHVGLSDNDLQLVARTGSAALKVSRADIAAVLAAGDRVAASVTTSTSKSESQPIVGATTVAGTMLLAHRAGIRVFVTGGIGGVHRDGHVSLDVSADLTELGRTPVCVVSAGVKSILDIQRTLEYLETQGVTTITFGDTHDFPAFFTRKSGFASQFSSSSALECARIIDHNNKLQLNSGILVAVPIPEQHVPANTAALERAIDEAVRDAKQRNITGKNVTPFVLDRVKSLSGGDSLKANIELVKNNARVGAAIAVEYQRLQREGANYSDMFRESEIKTDVKREKEVYEARNTVTNVNTTPENSDESETESHQIENLKYRQPVIIGGSGLDVTSQYDTKLKKSIDFEDFPEPGTSVPGSIFQSLGGVGRNVAEATLRTGGNPFFITAVGDDLAGQEIFREMKLLGFDTSGVQVHKGIPSAVYNAVLLPDGEMLTAVAAMDIHSRIELPDSVISERFEGNSLAGGLLDPKTRIAPLIALDCNLSTKTISKILKHAHDNCIPVLLEPTSVVKVRRVFSEVPVDLLRQITYITPNESEVLEIAKVLLKRVCTPEEDYKEQDGYMSLEDSIAVLASFLPSIIVKRGPEGIIAIGRKSNPDLTPETIMDEPPSGVEMRPSEDIVDAVSVTGAGDSLVGTLVTVLSSLHVSKFKRFLEKELDNSGDGEDGVGLDKEQIVRQVLANGGVIDQRMFIATLEELVAAVRIGMVAAEMSLRSRDAVSRELGPGIMASKHNKSNDEDM